MRPEGRSQFGLHSRKRQWIRAIPRSGKAATCTRCSMARITAVRHEESFSVRGIAEGVSAATATKESVTRAVATQPATDFICILQRPCETTSTSAGSPRLTTAMALFRAGARSFGSVIGPCAYTPRPLANLAKSTFGSVIVIAMWARSDTAIALVGHHLHEHHFLVIRAVVVNDVQ